MSSGNLFNFVALALALALAAACFSGQPAQAGQDCSKDGTELMTKCGEFVHIPGPLTDPSAACCDVAKRVDLPCVCGLLTPPVEKTISIEKVVYVAKKCGRPLPSGTKCGSFTVPKA